MVSAERSWKQVVRSKNTSWKDGAMTSLGARPTFSGEHLIFCAPTLLLTPRFSVASAGWETAKYPVIAGCGSAWGWLRGSLGVA